MTHSQKGESWSRGLPASCVMIVRETSTVCRRSQITRYGESGFVACVRRGIHWASHADFVSRMRSVTAAGPAAGLPVQAILDLHEQGIQDEARVADQRVVRPACPSRGPRGRASSG